MSFVVGVIESASYSIVHTSVQLLAGLTIGSALDYLFQTYVYTPLGGLPTSWEGAIELLLAVGAQLIVLCMVSALALAVAANHVAPDPACGLAFLLSSEYASSSLQQAMLNFSAFLKSEMSGMGVTKARDQSLENGNRGISDKRTILDSHNRSALRNLQTVAVYQ